MCETYTNIKLLNYLSPKFFFVCAKQVYLYNFNCKKIVKHHITARTDKIIIIYLVNCKPRPNHIVTLIVYMAQVGGKSCTSLAVLAKLGVNQLQDRVAACIHEKKKPDKVVAQRNSHFFPFSIEKAYM